MGCSAPCGFTLTMFGRRAVDDEDLKQKYERKLYIARESPEPIFDLSGCGLKTVPAGIYSICKVFRKETLLLEDNMLSTLEHGGNLSDLSCITTLNVSKNRFHSLDYSIRHLINLRELVLSHNELKFLPDSIGECMNLRILNVAQNRLKELPATLGNLKRLRKLYLTENDNLTRLCPELCNASNLILIDLDGERFLFPPKDVAVSGTKEIMRFLSQQSGVDYTTPNEDEMSIHEVDNAQQLDPFNKKETSTTAWEEYERNLIKLESQIHEAGKKQRQNFLETLTQEQTRIDSEVLKIQQQRESERSALIQEIQREEVAIDEIVSKLTEMNSTNPQRIEQMLEYDRREQERLIEMCRTNAEIRTIDTLDAMRALLEEEYLKELSVKKYGESKSEVHRSFLIEELEASAQLSEMLTAKDELQAAFVQQLLHDEDVQKAAVASLLERVDSRSWSLIQEISIVETNLAKLSAMEMEKSKFHLDYNMQKLSDQRLQLSYLLVELLSQQEMRREQLLETLKIMELEREEAAPNFWLRSYQQLMDSVPTPVIAAQRTLDPLLANNLLQEGVIHCLPFLVKLIQSPEHLQTITSDDLKMCGITLNSDRVAILKAIHLYLEEKAAEYEKICHIQPSAPLVTNSTTSSPAETPIDTPNASPVKTEPSVVGLNMNTSECVVCMEESCSVIFIPCGHLCCCQKCAESVNDSCPMCRGEIERKIRVMLP